jgi:hypothetical protein
MFEWSHTITGLIASTPTLDEMEALMRKKDYQDLAKPNLTRLRIAILEHGELEYCVGTMKIKKIE